MATRIFSSASEGPLSDAILLFPLGSVFKVLASRKSESASFCKGSEVFLGMVAGAFRLAKLRGRNGEVLDIVSVNGFTSTSEDFVRAKLGYNGVTSRDSDVSLTFRGQRCEGSVASSTTKSLIVWLYPNIVGMNTEADKIFAPHAIANGATLANIKFLSSCFAGAICGILGLQKQYGFALFAVSSLITAVAIYGIKMRPTHPSSQQLRQSSFGKGKNASHIYVMGGLWETVNPGQENVFSFLLLWTLFYG